MNIHDIEIKEDSQERLQQVAGKPTKNILFAPEFNAVVKAAKQYVGLFASVEQLNSQIPNPEIGYFAFVVTETSKQLLYYNGDGWEVFNINTPKLNKHIDRIIIANGLYVYNTNPWGEAMFSNNWDSHNLFDVSNNSYIKGRQVPFDNCVLKHISLMLRTAPSSSDTNVFIKVFKKDIVGLNDVTTMPNEMTLFTGTALVSGSSGVISQLNFTVPPHIPMNKNSVYFWQIRKDQDGGGYDQIEINLTFEENES